MIYWLVLALIAVVCWGVISVMALKDRRVEREFQLWLESNSKKRRKMQ